MLIKLRIDIDKPSNLAGACRGHLLNRDRGVTIVRNVIMVTIESSILVLVWPTYCMPQLQQVMR